jgi:predicted RNase H-like HicB family nuclease
MYRTSMGKRFNVIIEKDEDDFYIATVPALPGCHTQAKSLDDLLVRVREAIELYLEVEKDIGLREPGHFVGVQVIELESG